MILFLSIFLVPVLGSPPFRGKPLNVLCSAGNRVQLGACSPHFVECFNNQAILRKCPIRGEIFAQGVCRPAGRECHDSSISFLNEETFRLAIQEQVCGSGTWSGIFTSGQDCSRQALLCYGRELIAAACPNGYIIHKDFSCHPAPQQCYGLSTTVMRDFFLRKICQASNQFLKRVTQKKPERKTCNTWYINCHPHPSIVRCPAGSIFDESSNTCRAWQQGDPCSMSGTCFGREYQSLSLGDCQSSYLYCDGLHPKYLYCSPGMVFDGQGCVSPTSTKCPICKSGETRPSSVCSEYYLCEKNDWQVKKCPQGKAWRQEAEQCESSYTCATPTTCRQGEVIQKTCGSALICNGYSFDEATCPPNTRFNASTKNCFYDASCNPFGCREADVIYASDCKSFRICRNGNYEQRSCLEKPSYCASCGAQYSIPQPPATPAECAEGTTNVHQDDCTAYYQCLNGKWELNRCPAGEVWSSQWTKCVAPQYGEGCSIARESQCNEGERLFNPTSDDCRRLLECQAARWVEMSCPTDYYYDTESKNCLNGACPSPPDSPVFTPSLPGPQPPAPPPPEDNGYGINCVENEVSADPFDCSRYLMCTNGQMTTKICPVGSGFNPQNRKCEKGYSCDAECVDGLIIPTATCGHFKVCIKGKFWEGRCNLNKQFFNGECTKQDCQEIYFVPDCNEGAVLPPTSGRNSSSLYMVCVNGHWEERSCGYNTVFNFGAMRCEQQTAPLPPPSCYGGETRQVDNSCEEYEECFYGSWRKQRCPYGQRYSSGICVPGDCNDKCVEGPQAYRRDAFDCSKYYQCVHGKWMQRPCAPGTVFNERVLVCDWRRNVPECGGDY